MLKRKVQVKCYTRRRQKKSFPAIDDGFRRRIVYVASISHESTSRSGPYRLNTYRRKANWKKSFFCVIDTGGKKYIPCQSLNSYMKPQRELE